MGWDADGDPVVDSERCEECVVGGCRWFVLKQGKILWFKSDIVTQVSGERDGLVLLCAGKRGVFYF